MSDPKYTHQAEQLGAAVRDMALALSAFRDELIKQGFTRPEALSLCDRWLSNIGRQPPRAE